MGPLLGLGILFLIPMGCFSQFACSAENTNPSIREDAPPGTVVTTLITNPGYEVQITTPKFGKDGDNLILTEEVDYKQDQVIRVVLICTKDGENVPGESIFVEIINVNNNAPVFKKESYSFSVLENVQVNSVIGTAIEAEDADGDTLYYELIGNDTNAAAYFRLSSVTYPLLVVNKPLDYDLYPHIRLNLTARDTENPQDNPSFTATTSIIIDIIDVDDKPPFFQPCTPYGAKICINHGYRTSVNRSEAATEPLQLMPGPLYAVDGDYGINAPIAYSIIGGNDNNIFAIQDTNGNITMNKPVDTLGTIQLLVMAFQTTDALKYATTTVQIEVKEKNDFPPTFQKSNYYGTISANAEIRSFVQDSSDKTKQLQVFAADRDFPDEFNPAVTYRIENSTDFIVLRDGYILTNAVISSPGTTVFLVNATDSMTSESTTTIVTVEITPALTTTTTSTTPGTSATTTTTPSTGTTTSTTPGTGTTTTTTPSIQTTTSTTPGTGTTTTTTPSTGTTTSTTPGTGTTTTTTPSTVTTTSTTPGTGTTTTTTPSTGTTTSTTPGTGTTTTTTPSTGTTTSTTPGTGTTTTTTPSTGTTTSTTPGTGTTTTTTPSTQTTTSTTPRTGTTTTTTPSTQTTTSSTPGTGTTTTTTPSTQKTTSTTPGTGTTTTTTPSTQTTTSPTPGTGTTTTTTPSTQTTTSTTPGTGTTTTTTHSTQTTTSPTPGTGTTTTTTPSTETTTSTTTGTGTTTTTSPSTQTTTSTTIGTGTTTTPSTYTTTSTTTGTGTTTQSTNTGTGTTASTAPLTGTEGALLNDMYYSASDMAILGAVLGAVLALSLVGLVFLIYKQYGSTIWRRLGKRTGNNYGGSGDGINQLINDEDNVNITMPSNLKSGNDGDIKQVSSGNLLRAAAVSTVLSTNTPAASQPSDGADEESDSEDKKVKSILTKDLKEEGGYKSVWFREDAAPEVMVIEGAENGEANDDDDTEEEFGNQQGDDGEDDDDDELDPTFNITNNDANNLSIL